ncbi:MAG: multidrug efflux pump subunit AcrA (membrane-fusion protein) [Paraglaciecola sp.]
MLPGNNVQVNIDMVKSELTLPQGYQLPMTAIDSTEVHGQFKVWKIQNGKTVVVPIEVGLVNSDGVIVLSGIREGDVLAISNLSKLRQNMTLEGATQ